jgi:hypothetical protein
MDNVRMVRERTERLRALLLAKEAAEEKAPLVSKAPAGKRTKRA